MGKKSAVTLGLILIMAGCSVTLGPNRENPRLVAEELHYTDSDINPVSYNNLTLHPEIKHVVERAARNKNGTVRQSITVSERDEIAESISKFNSTAKDQGGVYVRYENRTFKVYFYQVV